MTLIDPLAPWEKPCGGGVTAKALHGFGVFESDLPRQFIDQITLYFGDTTSVTVSPDKPLAIVSRRVLGTYLLDEAMRNGVAFIKNRVSKNGDRPGRRRAPT